MKILHVHNIRWWNATSNYAYNIINALKELGHSQFVISGKDNPLNEKLIELNIDHEAVLPDKEIMYIPLVFKRFDTSSYDMIFTYWGRDQQIFVQKKKKAKLIRVRVDARMQRSNIFTSGLFKRTDMTVFPSELECERFRSKMGDLGKYHILEGCQLRHQEPKERDMTKPKILCIARTSPVKGHFYLIKAISEIRKKGIDIYARFIGNETEIPYSTLMQIAKQHDVGENIEFAGYVNDIEDSLQWANMGVVSSIGSEVYSRAIYEYFSFHLPAVTTNIGIFPEIYSKLAYGRTVPAKDPGEMAKAILEVWDNYSFFHTNIENYYDNSLSYEPFKKRIEDLLSQL